jgi:formylglycine-generating enzyme required for sulfatase activity
MMGANNLSDADAGGLGAVSRRIGGAFKDELPRHNVRVKPFCIMRDSLTSEQAEQFLKKFAIKKHSDDNDRDDDNDSRSAHVTWADAQALAVAITKEIGKTVRLPTEAEWEYASRGGLSNKHFPWGNISESYGGVPVRDIVLLARRNCRVEAVASMVKGAALQKCLAKAGESSERVPVREVQCFTSILQRSVHDTPANGFGLVNLVNNEWEWTSSRYMPYPYNALDGREAPAKTKKDVRVVRGGNNNTETCLGYTALRGYGIAKDPGYLSEYGVRFAMEK